MPVTSNTRIWSINLTTLFLYAVIINSVCCRGLFASFGFAVNKNSRKRQQTNVARFIIPDDYGESYKDVYAAIAKSRQVVTFRRQNSTVIAYTVAGKNVGLEESIGCKPLHSLNSVRDKGSPQHYVLLSGVAGDCRAAVRFLKQTALNHTFQFDSEPSGFYLANKLGEHLMRRPGDRRLAVHAFVISTSTCKMRHRDGWKSIGTIYEVGATGSVNSVRGGTIGGSHMQQARRRLEEHYRGDLCEVESRALVNEVLDPQLNGVEVDREGSGDEVKGVEKSAIEYVEIYDEYDS